MNSKTGALTLAVFALLYGLAGCGGGGSGANGGGNGDGAAGAPKPTGVGQSQGSPKTAVIGPAGGSLVSADGRVTITVPVGALAQDTTLGIEPITDMTRGGQGTAYRFTPHGELFATPATIRFTYTAEDTAGSAPENLSLAFQRADGYWQVVGNPVLSAEASTVSVQTTHFSDWVYVPSYVLAPASAVVKVGESVQLELLDCVKPLPEDASIEALVPGCYATDEVGGWLQGSDGWSVNGTPGGNAAVGTVTVAAGGLNNATYVAPATQPSPNQVAVSIAFTHPLTHQQTQLVSNITIIGDGRSYTGTAHFLRSDLHATATLIWTKYDELSDVSDYIASGMLEGTLTVSGCDPLPFAVSIASGSAADPLSPMSVFNGTATAPYTNSHHFIVQPDPGLMLTLTCSGEPFQMPASILQAWVGSVCATGAPRVYHSDITHLVGSWSCAGSDLTADWDFVMQ